MTKTFSSTISALGDCKVTSPLAAGIAPQLLRRHFTGPDERIRYRIELGPEGETSDAWSFEKAGPRQNIYFDPAKTSAGIVTCGGLSPGINNVIRSVVFELCRNYGVPRVRGYRFGLSAFGNEAAPPMDLLPADVQDIHKLGGSLLGSARGPVEPSDIVDCLVKDTIDILFFVGGDGTQRAAHRVAEEVSRRKLAISIIGIPKTIDNDVPYVYTSFGFATAVEESCRIIQQAGVEARSYRNTISVVKLMGRNAGFITAHATLAAQEVDLALIPEVPFHFEGNDGLFSLLEQKLAAQGFAVVVLSEGAGQDFFANTPDAFDASGNRVQHDIGGFMREKIETHFRQQKKRILLRYFDPGYSIRAVPANVTDAHYCDLLARAAVHAGMAGKTDMLVGLWYNNLTHVPLEMCVSSGKSVDPAQSLWRNVLSVTGQPESM